MAIKGFLSLRIVIVLSLLFVLSAKYTFSQHYRDEDLQEMGDADFQQLDPNTDIGDLNKYYDRLSDNQKMEIKDLSRLNDKNRGNLRQYDDKAVQDFARKRSGNPSLDINSLPDGSVVEGNTLKAGDSTIDLSNMQGSHRIESRDGKLFVDGDDINGGKNIHTENGIITIDVVERFISDKATIVNGVNVMVFADRVEADKADSIVINKRSTASNVESFSGGSEHFFVERADIVHRDCLYFYNVSETEFVFEPSQTSLSASNVRIGVDDCDGYSIVYKAGSDSSLFVSEGEPRTYTVTSGNLSFSGDDFVEEIEAYDFSTVTMDLYYGFGCVDLSPVGVYYYSSKSDKRVDFGIRIPGYGFGYRLCIRKDADQQFSDYDGIADLVGGFIELDGISDYLRYPLRNNELAGLVLEEVYQGLALPETKMFYDHELVFLNNVTVQAAHAIKTVSLVIPSNYYSIKEEPIRGEVHTMVKINSSLPRGELTDNIVKGYNGIGITNNLLLADNIMMLPLGHDMIAEVVN